jgi:hypothetical protein
MNFLTLGKKYRSRKDLKLFVCRHNEDYFLLVMPASSLADSYQYILGTYCLHLQCIAMQYLCAHYRRDSNKYKSKEKVWKLFLISRLLNIICLNFEVWRIKCIYISPESRLTSLLSVSLPYCRTVKMESYDELHSEIGWATELWCNPLTTTGFGAGLFP